MNEEFKRRYEEAEDWFDDVMAAVLASPWTLGAFIVWTLAAVGFGWWVGK